MDRRTIIIAGGGVRVRRDALKHVRQVAAAAAYLVAAYLVALWPFVALVSTFFLFTHRTKTA